MRNGAVCVSLGIRVRLYGVRPNLGGILARCGNGVRVCLWIDGRVGSKTTDRSSCDCFPQEQKFRPKC